MSAASCLEALVMSEVETGVAELLRIILELEPHSDFGVKGRPGIQGTQKALDLMVQGIMHAPDAADRRAEVAAGLIERKVRKAYRVEDAA